MDKQTMAFVEPAQNKQRPLQSGIPRLEQFWLFEARSNFYIVGFDAAQTFFRMLKINRENPNPRDISEIIREDPLTYTAEEINDILEMINEGNKNQGGLVKLCTACGIVGFVKFLNGFYLTMITQKKEVGCIGGNYIYTIKATEMFPIRPKEEKNKNALSYLWKQLNKRLTQTSAEMAENRYLGLFQFIDMTKDFFFSYSYDLTHSMQHNYITTSEGRISQPQDMFEWHHYQIHGLRSVLGEAAALMWTTPIIHGSFQQRRFTFFGKNMDLILIARRSRHYAGTRYLKRGINVHGKVANDVEVEQILQFENGADFKFTSYVQMRGSIPTFWAQETSLTMPKPPITLSRMDPDYLATQAHFADMMRRYSSPIIVLDLVKQHENRPRESLVGREFRQAIEIVNENIPAPYQVRYIALDHSKITSISKGKLSKAKPVKSKGFMGTMRPAKTEKERAMAAVGQEWAMMEKSLTKTPSSTTIGGAKGGSSGGGTGSETPPVPESGSITPKKLQSATGRSGTPVAGSSSSAATGGGAAAAGFASLDEARKAIDAEHSMATYQFTPSAHHAHALPGGYDDIAQINAIESRIDLLKELEDVATLTLSETAFFCNTTQFAPQLVDVIPQRTMELAERTGLILQSGVLRTNCIDCLDRTNGGQFAVAMRFLAYAFRALGVSEDHSLDITKDPVLQSLMEMYGEMGDKIALQYGGSEAHKKVIAGGKAAHSSSSSKQSELLTSIKRYYSNAFTDMMKQDAMNLFLGCFNPLESPMALWDMESDQLLHNLALQPPFPRSYQMMFEEIIRDSEALRAPSLRSKLEQRLKRVILYGLEQDVQQQQQQQTKRLSASTSSSQLLLLPAEGMTSTSPEDSGANTPTVPTTTAAADETTTSNKAMDETTAAANGDVTRQFFEFLTQQYFIRPLAHPETISHTASGRFTAPGSTAAANVAANRQSSKGLVNSITRQVARLERRRLMRLTAYRKVTKAAQDWWQAALREHVHHLLIADVTKEAKTTFQSMSTGTINSLSYYERFHQPHHMTEFDVVLAQEFMTPIVGAEAAVIPASKADMSGRLRSIAHNDDDEQNAFDALADALDETGVTSGAGGGGDRKRRDSEDPQPAINSLMAFFFSPPSPTNVPPEESGSGGVSGGNASRPVSVSQRQEASSASQALVRTTSSTGRGGGGGGDSSSATTTAGGATEDVALLSVSSANQQRHLLLAKELIQGSGPGNGSGSGAAVGLTRTNSYTGAGSNATAATSASGSGGGSSAFGLTKYVREIGQKARNIFYRKDGEGDEDALRSGGLRAASSDMTGLLRAAHDFNRRNAPITSLIHYIPQMSAVLYNQYAEIYAQPLLLLDPDPNQHQDLMRSITVDDLRRQYDAQQAQKQHRQHKKSQQQQSQQQQQASSSASSSQQRRASQQTTSMTAASGGGGGGGGGGVVTASTASAMRKKDSNTAGGPGVGGASTSMSMSSSKKTVTMATTTKKDGPTSSKSGKGSAAAASSTASTVYPYGNGGGSNSSKKMAADHVLAEEYKFLMRDCIIPLDDVRRMEQLAADGYIASDIRKGLFAGMSQMSSANLAVSLLFIALVNMEKELQAFGDHVEQQAEKSRARSLALEGRGGSGGLSMTAGPGAGPDAMDANESDKGGATAGGTAGGTAGSASANAASNSSKKLTVRSAFATPFLGLSTGLAALSSLSTMGGASNNLSTNTPDAYSLLQQKSSKTTSLEMTTALNDRIAVCLQHMRVANGLETEFRKYVNNYIFQQYNYLKELSLERLARRISTLSSEKSIMQYATQFEHDLVATEWNRVHYMAQESPNYFSFRELLAFQTEVIGPRQEMLQRVAKEYSAKQRQQVKAISTTSAAATAETATFTSIVHDGDDAVSAEAQRELIRKQKAAERKLRKQRLRDATLATLIFPLTEQVGDASAGGAPAAAETTTTTTTTTTTPTLVAPTPVKASAATASPATAATATAAAAATVTATATATAATDFALPSMVTPEILHEYQSFPFYEAGAMEAAANTTSSSSWNLSTKTTTATTSTGALPHAFVAAFQDFSTMTTHHFVQPDIGGFHQLAPDLFSRRTNPHMQMNEVCASRFHDVVLTRSSAATTVSVSASTAVGAR